MTKEELLLKGVSEEIADEIIAELEENPDENSLQSLQKALDKDDPEKMDDLLKAEKKDEGDEEDDDNDKKDDYNGSYMKKHMKRYMKENKKSCQKFMKEMDGYGDDMKKAIDNLDDDSEGAIIEMTDLKPFLDVLGPVIEGMAKAIPELAERIEVVSAQADKNYDLMKKAAKVTAENAEGLNGFLSTPNGRKGKVASIEMQKAQIDSASQNKEVYKVLMKAVNQKDRVAGQIISDFESSGRNLNKLNSNQKEYIEDLLKKEDK